MSVPAGQTPEPNGGVNVNFPECVVCGAAPGQAHDPTCPPVTAYALALVLLTDPAYRITP